MLTGSPHFQDEYTFFSPREFEEWARIQNSHII